METYSVLYDNFENYWSIKDTDYKDNNLFKLITRVYLEKTNGNAILNNLPFEFVMEELNRDGADFVQYVENIEGTTEEVGMHADFLNIQDKFNKSCWEDATEEYGDIEVWNRMYISKMKYREILVDYCNIGYLQQKTQTEINFTYRLLIPSLINGEDVKPIYNMSKYKIDSIKEEIKSYKSLN